MKRRILPRDQLLPMMRCEHRLTTDPKCDATIVLDGTTYQCHRPLHIDGIHDAFADHSDGGAVRW